MLLEALSAISGIVQIGTGIWQGIKSNEASKEPRPKYKIPESVNEATNVAEQLAYGKMPGYGEAKSNIEQQEASTLSRIQNSADSGSDVLGATTAVNLSTNRNLRALDASNEQFKSNALNNLKGQLMNEAAWKDKETQYNEIQPYEESMAASSVLGEGAIQNIAGGFNTGLNNYMSYKTNQDWLKANQSKSLSAADIIAIMGAVNGGQAATTDAGADKTVQSFDPNAAVTIQPFTPSVQTEPYNPYKQLSPFNFSTPSYYNWNPITY